jgi:hypothetical protein
MNDQPSVKGLSLFLNVYGVHSRRLEKFPESKSDHSWTESQMQLKAGSGRMM